MATYKELAQEFKVDPNALRLRLIRWQKTNDGGYVETANRKRTDPKYRYKVSAVRPIIDDLLADAVRKPNSK